MIREKEMKLIWSRDGKTVIVGLENIIAINIRDVWRDKNDESKGKRYLVYAWTKLDIKQYPSDGIFLQEFDDLQKAQRFIIRETTEN